MQEWLNPLHSLSLLPSSPLEPSHTTALREPKKSSSLSVYSDLHHPLTPKFTTTSRTPQVIDCWSSMDDTFSPLHLLCHQPIQSTVCRSKHPPISLSCSTSPENKLSLKTIDEGATALQHKWASTLMSEDMIFIMPSLTLGRVFLVSPLPLQLLSSTHLSSETAIDECHRSLETSSLAQMDNFE